MAPPGAPAPSGRRATELAGHRDAGRRCERGTAGGSRRAPGAGTTSCWHPPAGAEPVVVGGRRPARRRARRPAPACGRRRHRPTPTTSAPRACSARAVAAPATGEPADAGSQQSPSRCRVKSPMNSPRAAATQVAGDQPEADDHRRLRPADAARSGGGSATSGIAASCARWP